MLAFWEQSFILAKNHTRFKKKLRGWCCGFNGRVLVWQVRGYRLNPCYTQEEGRKGNSSDGSADGRGSSRKITQEFRLNLSYQREKVSRQKHSQQDSSTGENTRHQGWQSKFDPRNTTRCKEKRTNYYKLSFLPSSMFKHPQLLPIKSI